MQLFRQFSIALLLAGFLLIASAGVVAASQPAQTAAEGEQIFKFKCAACHTIGGGKLVGPDLKDVTQRRTAEWLAAFIANPQAVIDSGDKDAAQLVKDANGVIMPAPGLTDTELTAVIEYLKAPTGSTANANVMMGDPVHGEKLFTGGVSLANGGTACNACHSVAGVGFLGGGALGPDLTHAFTKFGGAAGMNATLAGLPFPTMQGVFAAKPLTPAEQADLLAFFQQADQGNTTSSPLIGLVFLAAGILGAGGLFGVMYRFWPKQSESLSEKLRKSKV
jgi:mono/diheme cytochrome c family protein